MKKFNDFIFGEFNRGSETVPTSLTESTPNSRISRFNLTPIVILNNSLFSRKNYADNLVKFS